MLQIRQQLPSSVVEILPLQLSNLDSWIRFLMFLQEVVHLWNSLKEKSSPELLLSHQLHLPNFESMNKESSPGISTFFKTSSVLIRLDYCDEVGSSALDQVVVSGTREGLERESSSSRSFETVAQTLSRETDKDT